MIRFGRGAKTCSRRYVFFRLETSLGHLYRLISKLSVLEGGMYHTGNVIYVDVKNGWKRRYRSLYAIRLVL